METKPCVMCDKQLEPAFEEWDTKQPYGGGEILFLFCFGSLKFDNHIGTTKYSALICDDCAEKLVPKMELCESS